MNEEEFRLKVEEILNPREGTELDVQYWIDNDLLPPDVTEIPLGEDTKRRKENKGRLFQTNTAGWTKSNPFKVCCKCKESKHITEYSVRGKRSRRLKYLCIMSNCRQCAWLGKKPMYVQKYQGDVNKKAREMKKLFVEYLGGCCSDCSFKGQLCQYDLDHTNPKDKNYNMSGTKPVHMDVEDIILEVNKCQLLCVLCHRKHSAKFEHQDEDIPEEYEEGSTLYKMASPVKDREYLRRDSPQPLNTTSA